MAMGLPRAHALSPAPRPHLLQLLLGLQDVPLHLAGFGLYARDEQGQLLGGSSDGWWGQRAAWLEKVPLFPLGRGLPTWVVSLPPPAPSCPIAGLTALEGGVQDLGSSGLSVGSSVTYPVLGGEALPPQEGSENGGPRCARHRGASRPPCPGSVSPTPPSSLRLLLDGGQAALRGVSESLAQPLIPEMEWLDLGEGQLGWLGTGEQQRVSQPNFHSRQPCLPTAALGSSCTQANKLPEETHSIGAGGSHEIARAPQPFPDLGVQSPNWDLTCPRPHSQEQSMSLNRVARVLSQPL